MTSRLKRFKAWFFEGLRHTKHGPEQRDAWWKVMCLTGVDYFSSMGFQPGISYLAAGLLSPLATLNLVILTLAGALPAYWLVAEESPYGQGSFAIFERLVPGWRGKALILILLGFAATDFIFTITMCAADATAHIIENPWMPRFANHRIIITSILITILGVVFILGFREAIKVSFWLVVLYLGVNVIAIYAILQHLGAHPSVINDWLLHLKVQYPSAWQMLATSFLVFPQLALGLSGFETGVAVMPSVRTQHEDDIGERVRNTRLLLVTVAVIMSIFLIAGSFTTTVLIAPDLFKENGPANGRALAYLAHLYLGDTFGTVYDIATVLILWFAGASGMAALLSLVPQYLPRLGMAPEWAAAKRPLVLFVTGVCLIVTFLFAAKVDPQAGAFATGLLVLITSAVCAITLLMWNKKPHWRWYFAAISGAFVYASCAIVRERPDGLHIALILTVTMIAFSFISRVWRSTELRIGKVVFDPVAADFLSCAAKDFMGEVRLLANRPGHKNYAERERLARIDYNIAQQKGNFIFLEVSHGDCSQFLDEVLEVTGSERDGYRVLSCSSPTVPNAIAAILLHARDKTKKVPHAYMAWTEGNPVSYIFKYVFLGEGETAPMTREILRNAEHDPKSRPKVHVV
jgi:hypothetical protein